MATVINNPPGSSDYHYEHRGSGTGTVLGIILAVFLVILALIFLVPSLLGNRGGGVPFRGGDTNIQVPNGNDRGDVNIPDRFDVNINTPDGR